MAGSTFSTPAVVDGTKLAGADLRTARGCFVELDASRTVQLCTTAGERPYGVLLNAPNLGEVAEVCVLGPCQVRAPNSTAVAVMARLTPQVTTGRAVTTTTAGHAIAALATEACDNSNAAGTFIEAVVLHAGHVPA